VAAGALCVSAAAAFAQSSDSPPTPTLPPSANRSAVPRPGDNKIPEGEAKTKLESAGYSNIQDLHLDADGIWRGVATKQGKSVDVSLDYQGNIFPR
jgi:putative membrane protein